MELAVAGSAVEWAVAGTVGKHVGQAQVRAGLAGQVVWLISVGCLSC